MSTRQLTRKPRSFETRRGPALNAALERAFERAEHSKLQVLQRPDMLNGETLAAQLGLSRATVDNRRQAGTLLALDLGSKRGFRYPGWQSGLLEEQHRRNTYERVLKRLKSVGAWSRYRFMTQHSPALHGKSPLDALLDGADDAVLRAADTWAAQEQGGG
jgi:hypothetical protein